MIEAMEWSPATIVVLVVVVVLFVLALRVAHASWTGKRGCHGGSSDCDCGHDSAKNDGSRTQKPDQRS